MPSRSCIKFVSTHRVFLLSFSQRSHIGNRSISIPGAPYGVITVLIESRGFIVNRCNENSTNTMRQSAKVKNRYSVLSNIKLTLTGT